MIASNPSINQTSCWFYELSYVLTATPCNQCKDLAERYSTAERVAIDIDLHHPVLLLITVSVHYCPGCDHYFRVQPPFMRSDAIYTNRVVSKAVQSVYHDGMAVRRVAARLARDFWVQPNEATIRG